MTALASASPHGPRAAWALALRGLAICALATLPHAGCDRANPPVPPGRTQITIGIPSATAPADPIVFSLTRTRLIGMDQSGHPRPAIVEAWDHSPDRRTWTFHVRSGVRLQDGHTASARDVAAAIQSARDGEDVAPGLWPIARVEVVGERAVRVHLSEPTAFLLEALTLVRALPTGPYRATEPEDGSLPEFEAHADTGSDVAAFRSVRLRRYDTPRAAVFALLRHEVDVLYDVPSEARAMLAKAGVRSFAHVKPYVVTLGLNHRHRALASRDVRRALNIAVDRAVLVEEEMEGFGIPAADLLWREHWSKPHAGDAEAMRVDRVRADQLLTKAGLPRRRLADGRELPRLQLHVLVVEDTTMARIAARLQRMYAAIGVELVLESLPIPDAMQRMAVGKYEAFLSPIFTGYGLSRAYLAFADHDRQKLAERGYRSAYEAAEALRRAPDDEAFARAVTTLHRVLLDDPPDVPLFWQQAERAVGPRVRVPDDVGVDLLGSLPRWTPVEGS